MSVLFWFSKTATRFSRHFTYSFFFLRHSRAASLKYKAEPLFGKWQPVTKRHAVDLRPIYTRRFSPTGSRVQPAIFYLFLPDTRAVPHPIASGAICRWQTAHQTCAWPISAFVLIVHTPLMYVGQWLRRQDKNMSGEYRFSELYRGLPRYCNIHYR